jgi:hypothetical protein
MHLRRSVAFFALALGACTEPNRTRFTEDTGPVIRIDGGPDGGMCIPGRFYCEGSNVAFTCDDRGGIASRTTCPAMAPSCVPDLGCRLCAPNAARCSPNNPLQTQRCRADGLAWEDSALCAMEDGSSCVAGNCSDRCSDSALGRSYLGCSYWPTITPNSGLNPMFRFAIVLANPQTYAVRATIAGGELTTPRVVMLDPGAIETVELPWVDPLSQNGGACGALGLCPAASSALVRGGAYHVQSNGPIAAYQFNPLNFSINNRVFSYTNDASLLLPQGVLTRRYTVSTWPDLDSTTPGGMTYGGFVSVVATGGENTQVTVRVTGRVRAGRGVTAMNAGEQAVFNLQQGDVLELVGAGRGDLTGTTIESSNPVAVFVGHDCTRVPSDRVACDHLEEQLLPDETWGRDYVVSALRDRGPGVPYVVRILSRTDGNAITFEPSDVHEPATLDRGQLLQFQTNRHFRVQGSGAFLVTQFMIGQGPAMGGTGSGDPAMVLEVPVQQYRDRYDFFVPSTYPQNFLNVVVPQGVELTLDDQPLRGSMEALGGFNILTLPIMSGAHRLRSGVGQGIGIKVYGIAPYTSYMYPGGLDLQLITPPG